MCWADLIATKGALGCPGRTMAYKWAPKLHFDLMGPTFNFNSQLQSSVLHLRSVFFFLFLFIFFFYKNMLVSMHLGKHASNYFILIFLHICFFFNFLFYFIPWWCWKKYLFTCLSSIGEIAYVGCYEKTRNTMKTKRKAR